MSRRKLVRVKVLARVGSRELRVVDAAVLLRLSYRQGKRYREEGAAGANCRGTAGQVPAALADVQGFPPRSRHDAVASACFTVFDLCCRLDTKGSKKA